MSRVSVIKHNGLEYELRHVRHANNEEVVIVQCPQCKQRSEMSDAQYTGKVSCAFDCGLHVTINFKEEELRVKE